MSTITATAISSRYFTKPKVTHRTVSRPSCLKRLRHFIEHAAWDERALAYEAKADSLCRGVLIASAFCLAPLLIKIFLR